MKVNVKRTNQTVIVDTTIEDVDCFAVGYKDKWFFLPKETFENLPNFPIDDAEFNGTLRQQGIRILVGLG